MAGFEPWMWEVEGEASKARYGRADAAILLEALSECDVVVAFFKNRAGSYLPDQAFQGSVPEPFHASVFEICHARALGKPVHLYAVGHSYKASLASILSVIADPLLLPNHAKILENEGELSDVVTEKLIRSFTVGTSKSSGTRDLDCDSARLERVLANMESAATFWDASYHAEQVPLIRDLRLPNATKRLYGQVLATAAGILANQASYDRAIDAARLSVRCFLELGSWSEMYAEVQALSGILNMAGRPNAERVNHFGLIPAMRAYHHLQTAYFDSAGSILMRSGHWRSARKWLRKAAEDNPTPYSQSKYGAALFASGESRDLDEASRMLYSLALPQAQQTGESLGYTLRHTASLAIAQEEFRLARVLLDQGETECLRTGAFHTLDRIRRLQGLVELVTPS